MLPLRCRACGADVTEVVADLGMTPLANAFVAPARLGDMEQWFPLEARVCGTCHLVQLGEHASPGEIFSDYVYFSSWSRSWVAHAERYVERIVAERRLGSDSLVVELASNDGYLLQHLVARGVPVLGIEPASNVAEVARANGVPTVDEFFGVTLAMKLAGERRADVIAANNVLAHVPDLHDFVGGVAVLLAPEGVATFEFPHLVRLLEGRQFDTIYHEHFSYLSLAVVQRVFAEHGLDVIDVEELPTHGGSLRVWAAHAGSAEVRPAVAALIAAERAAGLEDLATYRAFREVVVDEKVAILSTLLELRRAGKRVVGYGAAAKGNTLLNYCGIGPELVEAVVDANPHKQGLHLPGSHIPVLAVDALRELRPDVVFVLPWNLRDEIAAAIPWIADWGGRLLVRTPTLELLPA